MLRQFLISLVVGQRLSVVLSCVGFAFLHLQPSWSTSGPTTLEMAVFGSLVLLCCIEKLCSVMNLVAVERDWVDNLYPSIYGLVVLTAGLGGGDGR